MPERRSLCPQALFFGLHNLQVVAGNRQDLVVIKVRLEQSVVFQLLRGVFD